MVAPGETDLDRLLEGLAVARRPGTYRYVEVARPDPEQLADAEAVIREGDTTTLVVRAGSGPGRPACGDVLLDVAWLTLTVPSSLEAVGLTAAVAAALAGAGIACNVLAGARHDHLLVPVEQADQAERVLASGVRAVPG